MNKQNGFTLIELIMVIVILGILAATAIPKFVDLSEQAGDATAAGIAGSLAAAAAINYAVSKTPGATGSVTISDCDDTASALEGGTPAGWSITGAGPTGCTVTSDTTATHTATFTTIFAS